MTKVFRYTLMMFVAALVSFTFAQDLRDAVMDGDLAAVHAAIEAGEDLNSLDWAGDTALMDTVYFNQPEIAQALLAAGADVNAPNGTDSRTALMVAIGENNMEFAELFIAAGANINVADDDLWTPMTYAIFFSTPEVMEMLLDNRAIVENRGQSGETSLMDAVMSGEPEKVALLVAAGANVNAVDEDGWTALTYAAMGGDPEITKILLDGGADVDPREYLSEGTPLIIAGFFGHEEMMDVLLAYGADPDAVDADGVTAAEYFVMSQEFADEDDDASFESVPDIHSIAITGELEGLEEAIAAADDLDAWDDFGDTALMNAAMFDNLAVARALVNAGANVDALGDDGSTALMSAIFWESFEVMEFLVESGADINLADDDMWAPITYAIFFSTPEFTQYLLDHGANTENRGSSGETSLMDAVMSGDPENVQLLLAAGADIHAVDEDDWTALTYAARNESVEIVEMLVAAGADLNARESFWGFTPLLTAAFAGNVAVTDALLDLGADGTAVDNDGDTVYDLALMSGEFTDTDTLERLRAITGQ